jgi:hypothetical protein
MKSIILVAAVLLITALLANAQTRSYTINAISSDLHVVSGSCKVQVTEQMIVSFYGQYTFMGRVIPNRISYGTIIENLRVSSADVMITNSGYIKSSEDGTSKGILWDFSGLYPGGTRTVTFTLTYTVTGVFQALANGKNSLYWSYQFDSTVGTIDAKIYLPFGYNTTDVTAQPQARQISNGLVWFQQLNQPRAVSYDTIVTLPSSYGQGWDQCKYKPATFLQKIGIIITVCIVVAIFICCCVLCSIWGAIRRGLFWGERFGYGGGYGYNTVNHHHQGYYHSGGHHHHNSSSGSGQVSSYSGSSGFAG